jgi:hypothetical protein
VFLCGVRGSWCGASKCVFRGSLTLDDAEWSCGGASEGVPDGGLDLSGAEWSCSDESKGVFDVNGHFSYGRGSTTYCSTG